MPAAEEGTEDEARSHFRVGQTLYDEGRFTAAATEFDRAFELSGRTQLLYNAYLAHRDAGRLEDAVDRLRRYLEGTPDAPNREALEQRLAAMEETLEEQRRMAAMSAEERAALEAERERIAAEAEAHRLAAEQEREARQEAEARRNPTPIIVMGAGGAMLVGGLVTGVIARGRVSDIEDECPDNVCPASFDLSAARSEARRTTLATDILLAAGGATVATGLVLLILQRTGGDDEDGEAAEESARRPQFTGGCGLTGCDVNMQVNF